jgi:hypothetical protein
MPLEALAPRQHIVLEWQACLVELPACLGTGQVIASCSWILRVIGRVSYLL